MLAVAVAALAALTINVAASASLIRSLLRQQAREREALLNQIMHLAGRTWAPPPAEQWQPDADADFVPFDPASTPEY